MSHQDGSVYKTLSARPLASLHAKLDLIWHLFSNINILFWWENLPAVPWITYVWWMMPETEEDVFIFSWLSTWGANWNGLPIVYKFFWSDPSLWTCLSWPWPLRPLSYWPEAAVYTVCHVHIVNPMNPNYQCFPPLGLQLIYILFVRNVFLVSGSLFSCFFQSVIFSVAYSVLLSYMVFAPQSPVLFLKKLKSNFTVACHSFCVQAG